MPGPTMPYQTRVMAPGEGRVFVWDFANFPELLAGATIVSAVVTGPGGTPLVGLTAGTPVVLTAAAVVDSAGNTVAAGKGVSCALFAPSSAGEDEVVECKATLSNGATPVVQGKVVFRNAI